NSHSNRHLRADAESHVILRDTRLGDVGGGWFAESTQDLRTSQWKILAGANIERNALPSPGFDLQLEGGEGLDLRVRGNTLLVEISLKLTTDQVLRLQGRNRLQHFYLLVPH